MDSRRDLWSEIIEEDVDDEQQQEEPQQPQVAVFYRRRRAHNTFPTTEIDEDEPLNGACRANRLSLAPNKRISWNRSLSTRGRTSVSISGDVDYQPNPRQRPAKKKPKQATVNRKIVQPPNFEKEQAYFQEVDSVELMEESPSPKNFGTWAMGIQNDQFVLPLVSSRLGKWLASKKLNFSAGPSSSLSNILETPVMSVESDASATLNGRISEKTYWQTSSFPPVQKSVCLNSTDTNSVETHACQHMTVMEASAMDDECYDDIGEAIKRLSLSPKPAPFDSDHQDPFATLLRACKQSAPSTLMDVLSRYCDPSSIVKLGEGTYGEAFKAGSTVCKIVPIDGELPVNGEVQKKSAELLEEVLLSYTLNRLRRHECHAYNACSTFIETIDFRVCQGSYDDALIRAWEDWDAKHVSENDHPKEFNEKQCYVVFVLAHGGQDLEKYVLVDFNETRSILAQVTAGLAVAETSFEFEHRDLHWGNILLSHNEDESVMFTLEGKQMVTKTFGLSVSIIDFTLSRINTGEAILYLDLSADPEIFTGPKGDKQSETYRKMKEVTEECWEGSFPKTNVLWLQYLVDIFLLRKTYGKKLTSKDERDMRSLKKRLNDYGSAREALFDPFFGDLLTELAT